jgi:uncharacterized tellurite resistance protein B-like protein
MAAVKDRIVTLCELFVHVMVADGAPTDQERRYLTKLLLDLLCAPQLPPELATRVAAGGTGDRSLDQVLQELTERPAMAPQRLIELCSLVALTDGPLEDGERRILARCAERLGPAAQSFMERMLDEEAARESFVEKARIPL